MKNLLAIPLLLAALLYPVAAKSQTTAFNGWCTLGGTQSLTSGLPSSNYALGVIPNCSVTVYLTGSNTKATIYKDASGTTLTNPFNASVIGKTGTGQWLFYAQTGQGYDVTMTGGNPPLTYPNPVTLTGLIVGGGGGGGATPGLPAGSYQFNNNGSFGGNGQHLIASAFSGLDWGEKVTNCLAAIVTPSGTCDATSLASGTQTSANSVTIPAHLTLLWDGTVTMASGRKIVAANTSSFLGVSVYTASLVGNTAGPLLDGTAGGVTFDQFSVTNNDSSDSSATAATLALHDNKVGRVDLFGYSAVVLNIGAGYYGEYGDVDVYQFNPSGTSMQVTGANSTHFNHFKTVTTNSVGLAVDNTTGLYFDYADLENATTEEVLVGGTTPGRVYMGISGGYIQPATGAWDMYIGPNFTEGTVTTEGVTWFGFSTGCGPVGGCQDVLLNLGAGPSNNGAVTLSVTNYGGIGPKILGVNGDQAGIILAPTTGNPLAIVPCSTAWCVWNNTTATPTTNPLVMGMPLTTLASATGAAGFNLPPGVAPTSPNNGDCWTTTAGLFCQINGATVGPYGTGSGGGGNLSGTLTPNTYPIATGANTLGDGLIDYGLSASDTLTINATNDASTALTENVNGAFTMFANTMQWTSSGDILLQGGSTSQLLITGGNVELTGLLDPIQFSNNFLGGSAYNPGAFELQEGNTPLAPNTNYIQIAAPTSVTAYTMFLPGTQGTGALTNDGSGNLSWVPSGSGLSGMTAGQVAIAATATTITSSEPLAGSGAGITTGPLSGVTTLDIAEFTGTGGQIADSGTLLSSLAPKASPTFTGTVTMANLTVAGSTITFSGIEPSGGTSCLEITTSGVVGNTGAPCGSSGGGTNVEINGGSALTTANFVNNTGAGEIDFTNPSGSTVNATLHNTSVTINGQTATLGSTATIPFQTNSSGNTSQAGINLETSSTNAVGLTVTPTNSATNVDKFEITGSSYTGDAAGLTGGAVGSAPYQSAANVTAFIASPTTSGHYFVYSWQPSGSAIAPVALDLATWFGLQTINATEVNGAAVPASATALATNSSRQLIQATAIPAADIAAGALANGMTATTQTLGDNTTDVATDAFVLANSSTNPMTLLGDTIYGGAAGAATRLAGPTAGAGTYFLSEVTSGSTAVATSWTNAATYLASPPAIGGSAPAAGSFTSVKDTGVTSALVAGTNSGGTLVAATATNVGSLVNIAQYDVLVSGGTSAAIVGVAPGTTGLPLVSQGASANPAYASLALTALAAQSANSLVGNGTSGSAGPTALLVPSCSGAANALNWTSGTGPGCNSAINAAQLSGKSIAGSGPGITTGPVSGTVVTDIVTFSTTTGQIQDSGVKLLGKVQLVMPTTTINAGTCTSVSTVTITGLVAPSGGTPGSTFSAAFESNPSAVSGWGSTGSLTLNEWVSSANTMSWNVCNASVNNVTPGAINVDIGAH